MNEYSRTELLIGEEGLGRLKQNSTSCPVNATPAIAAEKTPNVMAA